MTSEVLSITFDYDVAEDAPDKVRRLVEATGYFAPAEVDVAEELVRERLAKGAPSGYHFVFADSDGRLIGYACYGPIACTVGSYDLYWIAVDKVQQRHGIGRRLLVETERLIGNEGGRHIYIETSGRDQYAPTRQFYQRCGYRQAVVFDDFYAKGDDKVVFRKILAPACREF